MPIYPLSANEMRSWKRTIVHPTLGSRHLALIFLANLTWLTGIFLLGRACLRSGVPFGTVSAAVCIVVAIAALAGYYEFHLHRCTKRLLAKAGFSEEQEKQVLTISYIAFRLYFILMGSMAAWMIGMADFWPR